ncbi:hypothetical protein M011DRAFT_373474, partial [Sporormia fimetaria CBS 119925]
LYLLAPPLLLAISIPFAVLAVFTTIISVSALSIRVSLVYLELGIALVQAYLFSPTSQPKPFATGPPKPQPAAGSPLRARNNRSSTVNDGSAQDAWGTAPRPRFANKSASSVSLFGSGEDRWDYEGVGGWRVTNNEEEEALWAGMNSRLELPAVVPRNHRRSLTGGS